MSPPNTLSRQEFIDAAFKIVREHGWPKLTARNLARELKSSTMPIYSHFSTMTDLEDEVIRKAMELLADYESRSHTGVPSLDTGIGYVLFAWDEPNLFTALNDQNHIKMQAKYGTVQFKGQVQELARHPKMKDLSDEQLRYLQFLAWTFVYGVACMKNWKDWIEETQGEFNQEALINWIRNGSRALADGFIQNSKQSSSKRKKNHS